MTAPNAGRLERLRKVIRFVAIYGVSRTLFKAAGRLRIRLPRLGHPRSAGIGIVGCGQFAFATIGYFLRREAHGIAACFDVDPIAQETFARAMDVVTKSPDVESFFAQRGLKLIYLASNHASHAPYAVQSLALGIDTYIEKPIAVSDAQFVALLAAKRRSSARVFAGYNRPFSGAIRTLRKTMPMAADEGITLQCFVSGHQLAPDHWYRRPEEGTRVCGNIGHWLDLMVHIFAWRGLPDHLEISCTWADDAEPDDNATISIRSDRADLFSVTLSSRSEPFEGINETINLQHGQTNCKIDDFRRMTIWRGAKLSHHRFWPKDVGHRHAILQPFAAGQGRDWHEVELSTLLMLHITQMVRERRRASSFSFNQSWQRVERELAAM